MPYSTIDKGSKYFDTKLYTGTGATQSITGLSFKPDWVWLKNRNSTEWHSLFDAVRGSLLNIRTNSTNAEVSATGTLTSFNSDGFSLGTDPSSYGVNTNTNTYVSWNWLGANTTVSNTAGTISSTVSANTTSGFSIVSFTGTGSNATVGHGLGVAPKMIILKPRSSADNWVTWHGSFAVNEYVYLNLTNAKTSLSTFMNSTLPSSSVISLGTWGNVNTSSQTMIAYCFAEIKGYSKAFSYTGNGSTDGTFIYTGFKPAFVMTKSSSTTGNWKISWNSFTNGNDFNLAPNLSGAEGSANQIDLLSNGFKCRASDTDRNGSGTTYIGFAFAENPFVSSKGIPTTAR